MRPFGHEGPSEGKRGPNLSEAETKLYQLLLPEYEARAINPADFAELYGEETISNDRAEVERIEKRIQADDALSYESRSWYERGKLFEIIVANGVDEADWLGPDATMIVPARHDDLKNDIDGIVEFEEDLGKHTHLALAVDITKSTRHLTDKMDAIRSSIQDENLSRVKYFMSGDFTGELRNVPRVVIGADREAIEEVSELMLTVKLRQQNPLHRQEGRLKQASIDSLRLKFMEARKALASHRLQFQILWQIETQLTTFQKYAERTGHPSVAAAYQRRLAIVQNVLHEKLDLKNLGLKSEAEKATWLREMREKIDQDEVHRAVLAQTRSFEHNE